MVKSEIAIEELPAQKAYHGTEDEKAYDYTSNDNHDLTRTKPFINMGYGRQGGI